MTLSCYHSSIKSAYSIKTLLLLSFSKKSSKTFLSSSSSKWCHLWNLSLLSFSRKSTNTLFSLSSSSKWCHLWLEIFSRSLICHLSWRKPQNLPSLKKHHQNLQSVSLVRLLTSQNWGFSVQCLMYFTNLENGTFRNFEICTVRTFSMNWKNVQISYPLFCSSS